MKPTSWKTKNRGKVIESCFKGEFKAILTERLSAIGVVTE